MLMKNPENVIRRELSLDKTASLNKLIGKRVLSKGGKIIGRISELRVDPNGFDLEGIVINGEVLHKPIYVGKGYFSRLSEDAVILNIEISVLIKDKEVIDSEGKIIGIVKEVIRKGSRNDLKGIYVRSLFSKKFFIPESAIDYISKSVILKPKYNARKKYFWQKDK